MVQMRRILTKIYLLRESEEKEEKMKIMYERKEAEEE